MKKIHLIVFLTFILAIAQSFTSKESYTAENTSSSDDKNANVNTSNEPFQQKQTRINMYKTKKPPSNPFQPKNRR